MINLLLVTHGDFGRELLRSSEIIIGKIEDAKCISFKLGESYEHLSEEVEKHIERMTGNGDELIVFTDMYGGSPYNAVSKAMKKTNFYHITGINFPLFIDIAVNRNTYTMDEISDKIIKNGKRSIVFINEKYSTD